MIREIAGLVLYGGGGVAIIILAWLQAMHMADRILITLIGSAGVSAALVGLLRLRQRLLKARNLGPELDLHKKGTIP